MQSSTTLAIILVWKHFITETNFFGHPTFASSFQRPSLQTVSNSLATLAKTLAFFLHLSSHQQYLCFFRSLPAWEPVRLQRCPVWNAYRITPLELLCFLWAATLISLRRLGRNLELRRVPQVDEKSTPSWWSLSLFFTGCRSWSTRWSCNKKLHY